MKKLSILAFFCFVLSSMIFVTCYVEFEDLAKRGPYYNSMGTTVSGQAKGSAQGFGGQVSVALTLKNGIIENAVVTGSAETAGIGADAVARAGKIIVNANSVEIDTISGASVTSNAIKEAGHAALDQLGAILTDEDDV